MSSTGGDGTSVTDLVGWQMTMPLGRVRWLGGLRGDSASGNAVEDAFVVADRDLDPGERIEIGSEGRSSETFLPLLFVDGDRDEFFGGLMWSGAWHAAFDRSGDQLRVSVFFPGVLVTVTPSRPLVLPHTFFGVTAHAATDESGALHQFILQGIRHGRPFQPLVTYNTWFIYGTTITEDLMVAEMDRAAALGVELRDGRRVVRRRRGDRRLRLRIRPGVVGRRPRSLSVQPRQPGGLRARARHEIRAVDRA